MMEENTAMAVMTIAICDEIRKDAQKLYRQLSTLVPDAELLLYRTRESLLKGLAEGHKICDLIFLGLDGDQGRSLETVRTMRLKGHYIPVVLVAENEKFYKEAFKCLPITIWSNRLKVENWNMFWNISWRYAGVKTEEHCIFVTGHRFIHCSTIIWRIYPVVFTV